jgi:hypothetical protein
MRGPAVLATTAAVAIALALPACTLAPILLRCDDAAPPVPAASGAG